MTYLLKSSQILLLQNRFPTNRKF